MFLLSIRCCFFYFYFHPLVVQSKPIPDGKNKHGTTYNMYTDPSHPFYPGYMKTSKAFKIFWKIAVQNFKQFWRFYFNRFNAPYGSPVPPYGVTGSHHTTHVAGVPAPPYGATVSQHATHVTGLPQPVPPYGAPGSHNVGYAVPYPAPPPTHS